jgi:hypothetical protein
MDAQGDFAGFMETLRTIELRTFAEFFRNNLKRATDLDLMYVRLILPQFFETFRMQIMTEVMAEGSFSITKVFKGQGFAPEFEAEVDKRMNDQREEAIRFASEGTFKQVKQLSDHEPGFAEWVRALEHSAIMATWSAFETLAADVWVHAVNSRPELFAARVLKAFTEGPPEGMSSRSIPIGLAAKYDFDLRNCIGDIVAQRIDFTSLEDIRKAYKAAFELDAGAEETLRSADLHQLLLARNLVAHRSGIVDSRYRDRSGTIQQVGEALAISDDRGAAFIEVVRKAGRQMLRAADLALTPVQ